MKLICIKCGYTWEARTEHPKECPACKNRKWDEPKKEATYEQTD